MRPTRFSIRTSAALLAVSAALAAVPALANAYQTFYLLENFAYTGKCMDNYRGYLTDGNHLQIYNCQNSVNQKFTLLSDGHVVVQQGQTDSRGYQYCMDYYPTNGSIGSQVKIWPCHPISTPSDTQHWYYLGSNQFMGASGNCVSAPAGTNETRLVMAACNVTNPAANTRWRAK
jgi:hypothetical protein